MRQKVVGAAAGRVVIQRTRPPSLDPVRRPPAVGGRVRRSHPWRRCTCSTCAWCRSNTAAHAKGHVRTAHMCIAMAGHSVQAWRSCRSRSCSFRRSRTPCGYRTRSCCPRAPTNNHQQAHRMSAAHTGTRRRHTRQVGRTWLRTFRNSLATPSLAAERSTSTSPVEVCRNHTSLNTASPGAQPLTPTPTPTHKPANRTHAEMAAVAAAAGTPAACWCCSSMRCAHAVMFTSSPPWRRLSLLT